MKLLPKKIRVEPQQALETIALYVVLGASYVAYRVACLLYDE